MRNKYRLLTILLLPLVSIIALLGVVLPAKAHADSVLPDVHIVNLGINSSSYKAGDLVSGSFTIVNQDSVFAPNITYVLDLAGGYSQNNGIPTTKYDEKVLGTVSLNPGQSETIPFTYSLPLTVNGTDLGIRIQAETHTGLYLGWQDAEPITITGGTGSVTMIASWLAIGQSTFDPNAGPTLSQGQTITYNLTIKNTTGKNVSFTPHISFYNMSTNSTPLNSVDEPTVSLTAGETKTLSYNLPNFDWKPLVYAGQVVFADSQGEKIIPTRTFRYIIAGPIATIQSILTQSTDLSKGQSFSVTMTYTGTPQNITTGGVPDGGMATATIAIYNQSNQIVATTNQSISLNVASITPLSIPLTSKVDASSATVEATIFNSEGTLYTYNAALFHGHAIPSKHSSITTILIVIVIALVIIVLLYLIWRRWPKTRFISIIFIIAAGSVITFAHSIQAFVVVDVGPDIWDSLPEITNNSPYPVNQGGTQYLQDKYLNSGEYPVFFINTPSGILSANTSFTLTGSDQAEACGNQGAVLVVNASFNGSATSTATSTNFSNNDHQIVDFSQDFTLPVSPATYTTPGPGSYQVNIQGVQYPYYRGFSRVTSFTDGYQPFLVGGVGPTVTLVANPNQVTAGASTTLTWTSINTNSCSSYPSNAFQTNGATSNTIGTSTQALFTSTTYTIVCSGPGGYATSSAPVTVDPLSTNTSAVEIEGTGSGGTGAPPSGFQSYINNGNPTYANPAYFQNVVPEIGPTNGLAAWWQFNDGSGTTAADSSGNGYTGTLVGNPTWIAGENGDALSFNGSQYVNAAPPSQINFSGAFSVSLWIKYASVPSSPSSRQIAFALNSTNDDTSQEALDIEFPGDGTLAVVETDNDGYDPPYSYSVLSTAAPSTNTWHHVVYVQDGQGDVYLYVDGSPSQSYDWGGSGSTIGFLRIAGFNDTDTSNNWVGSIDDVRVYDDALSQSDVTSLESGQPTVTANAANTYGYTVAADTCTYPVGQPGECTPNIPATISCSSSWCSAVSTISSNAVTKFAFEYFLAPTAPLIIHGVGPSNTTADAPPNNIFENYATGFSATTNNPQSYQIVLQGQDISNGLAGFWPFNDGEGDTVADASGNNNRGTITGGVTTPVWIQGQYGGALWLSPEAASVWGHDYVLVNNTIPTLNSYSSCAFIEGDSSSMYQSGNGGGIMSRYQYSNPNDNGEGITIMAYGDTDYYHDVLYGQQWYMVSGSQYEFQTTNAPAFSLGQWHQICVTYGDSGNIAQFYWDGQPLNTIYGGGNEGYTTPWNTANGPLYIGSTLGYNGWTGGIDDARLYNRQLSAQEIQNLYQLDNQNQLLAYGSYLPGYTITAGVCDTSPSCIPTSFSTTPMWCNASWCDVAPPLSSNETTNVYFKYQKIATTGPTTGDVEIEQVGSIDKQTDSAPSGLQSFIIGTSTQTVNPAYFRGISNSIVENSLFNTGVDNSGNPLTAGVGDNHWEVSGAGQSNAAIATNPWYTWVAPVSGSSWVSPFVGSDDYPLGVPVGNTNYNYTTTFSLSPNEDADSAILNGTYSDEDNLEDILLNGLSTGINDTTNNNDCNGGTGTEDFCSGGAPYPFSISSSSPSGIAGFRSGLNTLTFVVKDHNGNYGGLSGLNVGFNPNSAVTYAYSSNVNGDGITYGTCTYPITGPATDCTPVSPNINLSPDCTADNNAWCAAGPIPITAGDVTKVEFYYTPAVNTGDIVIESVNGSNNTFTTSSITPTVTAPGGGTITGTSGAVQNTFDFDNVATALVNNGYTVAAPIPSGNNYSVSWGYYQYVRGPDPGISSVISGNTNGWGTNGGWHTCTGSTCSINGSIPVTNGEVTEVVFQYAPPQQTGCTLTPTPSTSSIGQTITWNANWDPTDLGSNPSYVWWGSGIGDGTDSVTSNSLNSVTPSATTTSYSSPGDKTVNVTINGTTSCQTSWTIPINFNSSFQEL